MKSIYGLEIIASIALNKAISKIGEKIYRLLYKTYFRTLQKSSYGRSVIQKSGQKCIKASPSKMSQTFLLIEV